MNRNITMYRSRGIKISKNEKKLEQYKVEQ
jgi:hypothetical protein